MPFLSNGKLVRSSFCIAGRQTKKLLLNWGWRKLLLGWRRRKSRSYVVLVVEAAAGRLTREGTARPAEGEVAGLVGY